MDTHDTRVMAIFFLFNDVSAVQTSSTTCEGGGGGGGICRYHLSVIIGENPLNCIYGRAPPVEKV